MSGIGKKEYKKFMKGERLTRKEAILAKCYDCMGEYYDGKIDCGLVECPLYQYMPYRKNHAKTYKKSTKNKV